MNDFVVSGQKAKPQPQPQRKAVMARPAQKSAGSSQGYAGMIGDYMPLIIAGIAIYFIAKK